MERLQDYAGKAWGNSVAPLPGGGIAVTVSYDGADPEHMKKVKAGEITGYVLEWQPGSDWQRLNGSELSANNGIVATTDGKLLYVADFGNGRVVEMSRDGAGEVTSRQVLKTPFDFIDNIRWSPNGTLLVAGHGGTVEEGAACIESYESICDQDYGFVEVDPEGLQILKVVEKDGSPEFGSASTVIRVADEYWIGTFRGDRLGRMTVE